MKKIIFISVAIISLIAQIANPLWLVSSFFMVVGSFDMFLYVNETYRVSFTEQVEVFFIAIGFILAFIVPIWSIILAGKLKNEEVFNNKKNILFLVINIIPIILSILFIVWNGGFEISMRFP